MWQAAQAKRNTFEAARQGHVEQLACLLSRTTAWIQAEEQRLCDEHMLLSGDFTGREPVKWVVAMCNAVRTSQK